MPRIESNSVAAEQESTGTLLLNPGRPQWILNAENGGLVEQQGFVPPPRQPACSTKPRSLGQAIPSRASMPSSLRTGPGRTRRRSRLTKSSRNTNVRDSLCSLRPDLRRREARTPTAFLALAGSAHAACAPTSVRLKSFRSDRLEDGQEASGSHRVTAELDQAPTERGRVPCATKSLFPIGAIVAGLDVLVLGQWVGPLDGSCGGVQRIQPDVCRLPRTHRACREADCRATCRAGVRHRLAKPNEQALENRYPSLGGSRVQIPPPPLPEPNPMRQSRCRTTGSRGAPGPRRSDGGGTRATGAGCRARDAVEHAAEDEPVQGQKGVPVDQPG